MRQPAGSVHPSSPVALARLVVVGEGDAAMTDYSALVARLRTMLVMDIDGSKPANVCIEAADAIEALIKDVQAYRGVLGYPVPIKFSDRLQSGETPTNGIAEALHGQVEALRKETTVRITALEYLLDDVMRGGERDKHWRRRLDAAIAGGKP